MLKIFAYGVFILKKRTKNSYYDHDYGMFLRFFENFVLGLPYSTMGI